MPFLLNGSSASLAPVSQQYEDLTLGRDHNGAPILSAYKNILLEFPECSVALMQQWAQFASTGTSLNTLTVLTQDSSASFSAFSGIYLEWAKRPELVSGVTGAWSLRVTNVKP